MKKTHTFNHNLLKLHLRENDTEIQIDWQGKSVERKPGEFITPILLNALKTSSELKKQIVLDFSKLEYMNSSTITPLIKILERAKRGSNYLTVLYDKNLKWQELSFSALRIFQTEDQRVSIKGKC